MFKMENCTIETKDVLIIGCGISGIAAAITLLENKYENFFIIEGLDRIGGRCNTIEYG